MIAAVSSMIVLKLSATWGTCLEIKYVQVHTAALQMSTSVSETVYICILRKLTCDCKSNCCEYTDEYKCTMRECIIEIIYLEKS